PSTPPPSVLLLDVRNYVNYAHARVSSAVNLWVPQTLLKRAAFGVDKLLETLGHSQQQQQPVTTSTTTTTGSVVGAGSVGSTPSVNLFVATPRFDEASGGTGSNIVSLNGTSGTGTSGTATPAFFDHIVLYDADSERIPENSPIALWGAKLAREKERVSVNATGGSADENVASVNTASTSSSTVGGALGATSRLLNSWIGESTTFAWLKGGFNEFVARYGEELVERDVPGTSTSSTSTTQQHSTTNSNYSTAPTTPSHQYQYQYPLMTPNNAKTSNSTWDSLHQSIKMGPGPVRYIPPASPPELFNSLMVLQSTPTKESTASGQPQSAPPGTPPFLKGVIEGGDAKGELLGKWRLLEADESVRVGMAYRAKGETDVFAVSVGLVEGCGGGSGVGVAGVVKNRYSNIWPFNYNRVKLQPTTSAPSDYINASYIIPPTACPTFLSYLPQPTSPPLSTTTITPQSSRPTTPTPSSISMPMLTPPITIPSSTQTKSPHPAPFAGLRASKHSRRRYIATQAPTKSTSIDFWRMIWDHDVSILLMLCDSGSGSCITYWPTGLGNSISYTVGEFQLSITLVSERRVRSPIWLRGFKVSKSMIGEEVVMESRVVAQVQYIGWPDAGVPSTADEVFALHYLVERVREAVGVDESARVRREGGAVEEDPVLVHCSAGCGRTGAYVALDALLYMMYPDPGCLKACWGEVEKIGSTGGENGDLDEVVRRLIWETGVEGLKRASGCGDLCQLCEMGVENHPLQQHQYQQQQQQMFGNHSGFMAPRAAMESGDAVMQAVHHLRSQRISMVQTMPQFLFLYEVLLARVKHAVTPVTTPAVGNVGDDATEMNWGQTQSVSGRSTPTAGGMDSIHVGHIHDEGVRPEVIKPRRATAAAREIASLVNTLESVTNSSSGAWEPEDGILGGGGGSRRRGRKGSNSNLGHSYSSSSLSSHGHGLGYGQGHIGNGGKNGAGGRLNGGNGTTPVTRGSFGSHLDMVRMMIMEAAGSVSKEVLAGEDGGNASSSSNKEVGGGEKQVEGAGVAGAGGWTDLMPLEPETPSVASAGMVGPAF
ncbi:hypothetical protein HDU76_006275, partial [Blyttiomyces sp. JEL0837]